MMSNLSHKQQQQQPKQQQPKCSNTGNGRISMEMPVQPPPPPLNSASQDAVLSPATSPRCPIDLNMCQNMLRTKLDPAQISLCPMMRKSHSNDSKDLGLSEIVSTPTDSLRVDTPDGDKVDLRHLSLALMKLLYPKTTDVYQIIKSNTLSRNVVAWENATKIFSLKYSIDKLTDENEQNVDDEENRLLEQAFNHRNSATSPSSSSSSSCPHANGSAVKTIAPNGSPNISNHHQSSQQKPHPNVTNSDQFSATNSNCTKSESNNNNCHPHQLHNNNKTKNDDDQNTTKKKEFSDLMIDQESLSYDQLEQLAKYLAKKLELNWEELIVECGEQYAQQCFDCDSKSLKFVGENLIEFLVNVENIQSIAYKEIASLQEANQYWPPSQPDLLPITVFVNHSETEVVITYNIQKPICHFIACFLSGLFRKLARCLFKISIRIRVEIGSDQYKFVIKNRTPGTSLINNDSFVSRYKQSLLTKPEQLLMSVGTFRRVFPFHFMCDQNLRFIQYGTGITRFTKSFR